MPLDATRPANDRPARSRKLVIVSSAGTLSSLLGCAFEKASVVPSSRFILVLRPRQPGSSWPLRREDRTEGCHLPQGPPHKADVPGRAQAAIWVCPRLAGAFLPHSRDVRQVWRPDINMADDAVFESSRPEDAPQDLAGQWLALDWPAAGAAPSGETADARTSRTSIGLRRWRPPAPSSGRSTSASAKRDRRLQKRLPLRSALGGQGRLLGRFLLARLCLRRANMDIGAAATAIRSRRAGPRRDRSSLPACNRAGRAVPMPALSSCDPAAAA